MVSGYVCNVKNYPSSLIFPYRQHYGIELGTYNEKYFVIEGPIMGNLNKRLRFVAILFSLCLLYSLIPVQPVFATSITVNTALDLRPDSSDGKCSLRAAIAVAQANSNASDTDCVTGLAHEIDVIQIDPLLAGQTLTLNYNPAGTGVIGFDIITVSGANENRIEIIGPTTNRADFVINANNATRPFYVGYTSFGTTDFRGYLKLSNLTISGGNGKGNSPGFAFFPDNYGGAAFLGEGSELTLDNVEFRNNFVSGGTQSANGGAIYGVSAKIISNGGAFVNNSATSSDSLRGRGGAIFLEGEPSVLEGYAVRFQGNSASYAGGVLATNPGTISPTSYVTLQRSLAMGNSAPNGGVAFIESAQSGSTLPSIVISDSTISGNSAGTGGVVMSLTTVARIELYRNTFYNNTATQGGLYSASRVAIYNSILHSSTCFSTAGGNQTGSRNLVGGVSTGCTAAAHDVIGTVNNFDTTLRQNGGSQVLESHRLIAGSNAIDNGNPDYCGTMDQRTIKRGINGSGAVDSPMGGDCDIGAYEYAPYVINFVTGTSTVTESSTNHQVGIKLTIPDPSDSPLSAPLTVTAITSGSATQGVDYNLQSTTVNFPAGSTTGSIVYFRVNSVDDFVAEQTAETVILSASAPGAALAAPTSHTVSIQDNDTPGIDVDDIDGSIVVSENTPGVSDNFRIKLQSQPDFNANVLVKIQPDKQCGVNNTGRGAEYGLTITNANWQTWHNVSVQPYDDWVDDDDENETVTHNCVVTYDFDSADPVYNNTFDTLYVSVYDNDVAGVNIIQSGGNTDLSEDGQTDTYTIALNSQPDTDPMLVTTVYADPDGECSVNGGAPGAEVAVANFNSPSMETDPFGDWVKADWETPKTVTVTANNDLTVEPNGDEPPGHHCVITHRVASSDTRYQALNNANHPQTVATKSISADIVDNDPPFIDITANAPLTVSEASATTADTYSIVLYRRPLANVTINLSVPSAAPIGNQVLLNTTNNAATAASTLALTFTPANWNTPQTVYVFPINDDYDEDKPHSTNITHTITTTAYGFSDPARLTFFLDDPTHAGAGSLNTIDVPVTITDNDISEVITTPTTVNITEGGTAGSYSIRLATHPYQDVTVTSTPSARCNLGSGLGVAVNTVIAHATWNTVRNIPITVTNDNLVEGSYSCLITHTVASADTKYSSLVPNSEYGPDDVTVNVTDDDLPNILLTVGTLELNEATATTADSYRIVLEKQPTADVTITLSVPSVAPIGHQVVINNANNAATASTSLALTFTSSSWNTAQTVYVFPVDDTYDEADPHMTQINHSVSSTAIGFSTAPVFIVDGGIPSPDTVSLSASIADNDTASVDVSETGTTNLTEDGAQDTYTIRLGTTPFNPVTVTVTPGNQCAVNGGTAGEAVNILIAPADWNTSQVVMVAAINDLTVEGPHSCTISHTTSSTDAAYEVLDGPVTNGPANVTANITDNDNPEIDITTTDELQVSESAAATADTYSVVLARRPLANVTVNLSVPATAPIGNQVLLNTTNNAGTAASTLDLTFTPANWNTPQTVYVFAVNDHYDEPDPHLTHITHTVSSTAYGFNDASKRKFFLDDLTHDSAGDLDTIDVPVTITDDDTAGVTITESGTTEVTEGSTTDSYTVVLTSQPTSDVTVTLTFGGEITVAGESDGSVMLTFDGSNWSTAQTVTVAAVDDRKVEGSHTAAIIHAVNSSDGLYNGITVPAVTVTIADNDSATITFASPSGAVPEATTPYTVDAVLTLVTSGTGHETLASAISAAITETEGTALSPADYSLTSGSVAFDTSAVSGATRSVEVGIMNDNLVEGSQTFTVGFGATTGPTSASGTHSVTVLDNDTAAITFATGSGDAAEGDTPYTVNAVLTITSNPVGGSLENGVAVVVNQMPGTAVTPADYSLTTTQVSFAAGAGSSTQPINIAIVDDAVVEADEGFTLGFGVVTGQAAASGSHVVTITDNDVAGVTITESGTTAVTEGSTTDSYTVVLTSHPTSAVTVTLTFGNEITVAGENDGSVTLTFDDSNWNTAQTVTVAAVDDRKVEGSHAAAIIHAVSSSDGLYNGITVPAVTVTITDNDSAAITFANASGDVSEATTAYMVDAVLILVTSGTGTEVLTSAVSAGITAADGTALNPADYNLTSGSVDFDISAVSGARTTIVVSIVNDSLVEGDQNFTLGFGATTGAVSASGTHSVTILDNDTAAITFASVSGSVSEGITPYTLNAVLTITSDPSGGTLETSVDVIVSQTPGTAVSPADYNLITTQVNFAAGAGNSTQPINTTIVNDVQDEDDETFTLSFGTITGQAAASGTHSVTITDNDMAGMTITESGTTEVTEASSNDSYTVVLTSEPTSPVMITLSFNSGNTSPTTSGVPAGILVNNQGSPVMLTFTASDWNQPQILTVSAPEDAVIDGQVETILHDVESLDGKYAALADRTVAVNVKDSIMTGPNSFSLIRPVDHLVISSSVSLDVFQWEDPVNAALFNLMINQTMPASIPGVLSFQNVTGVADSDALTCDGTICTFTLTTADQVRLTDGTYEWTVTASNAYGTLGASNQPFTFTINAISNVSNLLINGGFEITGAEGERYAAGWTLLEGHDDIIRPLIPNKIPRRVCKPAKAAEGNCAFRLGEKGSYNWNRMLKQKIVNPVYGSRGDMLTLNAQVKAKNLGQKASIKLVVKYDIRPKQKVILKIKKGNYDYRLFTENLMITDKPSKIIVTVNTDYNTGFFFIDDVQLLLTPGNLSRNAGVEAEIKLDSNLIPLPSAPSN